jgi:hypothetical protein
MCSFDSFLFNFSTTISLGMRKLSFPLSSIILYVIIIEQYIVQNTGKELLTDLTDGTLTQTVSNVSSGYITLIDDNIQYDGTKWKT